MRERAQHTLNIREAVVKTHRPSDMRERGMGVRNEEEKKDKHPSMFSKLGAKSPSH